MEICYYMGGRLFEPRDKNVQQSVLEVDKTHEKLPTEKIKHDIKVYTLFLII